MHLLLFSARGDFADIATIVIVIVIGVIRFLYSIMKKPDVPPVAPPQNVPQTPDALQQEIEKFIRQAQGREPRPIPIEKPVAAQQRPPEPVRQRLPRRRATASQTAGRKSTETQENARPETRAPELAPTRFRSDMSLKAKFRNR